MILRKTAIPVIPGGTYRSSRDWARTGPTRILYATDLSDVSFRSLAYARSVSSRTSRNRERAVNLRCILPIILSHLAIGDRSAPKVLGDKNAGNRAAMGNVIQEHSPPG